VTAPQTAPIGGLKQRWRELYGKEPPPFSRRYIESQLAYRIQELAYSGLKPETQARLEAVGEQFDGGHVVLRRIREDRRPLPGTRLVREYDGVEHVVTVRPDDFEYAGGQYQNLSAIARAITGTCWNRRGLRPPATVSARMNRCRLADLPASVSRGSTCVFGIAGSPMPQAVASSIAPSCVLRLFGVCMTSRSARSARH
jgi:hypothetical protein